MIKFKKVVFYSAIILFTISLVLFATSNISSTKSGLTLWATSIVPSLFPFFVATELLSKTNIPYIIGNFFKVFMRPIFNVDILLVQKLHVILGKKIFFRKKNVKDY